MPSPHQPQELSSSTVDHSEAAITQKRREKKKTRKQVEGEHSPRTPTVQMEYPTETGTTPVTKGSLGPLTLPTRHAKKKTNLKSSTAIHPTLRDDAFQDEPTAMSNGARNGAVNQLQPNTPAKRKKKTKQQRQGEEKPAQRVPVEEPLYESFQILGLAVSESTKPNFVVKNHNHSDSLLHASGRTNEVRNDEDKDKIKSRSKSNTSSLNEAMNMNHSRRDPMVQHKQRRKVPQPLLHPGTFYSMAPRLQSAAMALSAAGAGVAGHRQMRKDHKHQEEDIPTNSISVTTVDGRSTAGESTKTSKGKKPSLPKSGNIQWKPPEAYIRNSCHRDILHPPPSPPPSPAQTEQKRWCCSGFFSRHNFHGVSRGYRPEAPVCSVRERRLDAWTPQLGWIGTKKGRVLISFGRRKESR